MRIDLKSSPYEDFVEYNNLYYKGEFRGSEATPYNLEAIKKWLDIRDTLKYTEDFNGNWCQLNITKYSSRYDTDYIYIDKEQRLWRTFKTADEFYKRHSCHKDYFEEV